MHDPNKPLPGDGFGGNMYGVKEDILISKVDKYIHIGSEAIHRYDLYLGEKLRMVTHPSSLGSLDKAI